MKRKAGKRLKNKNKNSLVSEILSFTLKNTKMFHFQEVFFFNMQGTQNILPVM